MNKGHSGSCGRIYCVLVLEGGDWSIMLETEEFLPQPCSVGLQQLRRKSKIGEAYILFFPTQDSLPSSQRSWRHLIFLSGYCVFSAGDMCPHSCHCWPPSAAVWTLITPLLPWLLLSVQLLPRLSRDGSAGMDLTSWLERFPLTRLSQTQARGFFKVITSCHMEHLFQCSAVRLSCLQFFEWLQPKPPSTSF